jgi:alcohol dehydrogenase (cytochrome c)
MKNRILLPLVFVTGSLLAQVTYDRLLHADHEPQNWLTYSGGYASQRYSTLTQVNRDNVKNLQMKWVYRPTYQKTDHNQSKMENTPLVIDGVVYTGTALEVVALDAVTGRQFWTVSRPLDPTAYYNAYEVNKGMAIADDTLFWATVDCHLLALDRKTGRILWDVAMTNWKKGYQYNVAPLIVRNMIILGPATNEAGANCWVNAYDIKTGKELWRFYTSPMSADDPVAKTWAADSWKHGGSPVWNSGSYDPETNLTFWGTGNPNPGWSGDVRAPGDNLYSESVVALDADTGKLKWYFQFTPGDEYDWDSTQVPVLADINWQGKPRKVMLWANRNGFFYVLDRTTGEFLLGKPFIKETWANGLDKDGRPIKAPEFWPKPQGGIAVMPGSQGGTNWYPPSFSPQTGLFYLSVWDNYKALSGKGDPGPWAEGQRYVGNGSPVPCVQDGHVVPGSCAGPGGPRRAGGGMRASPNYKTEAEGYGAIRAIDPETGEKKWDFKMVNNTESGVLSTAGGLVFGGGMDGDFIALDAKTGEPLWHAYLGGPNASGPISYAVDGKQYIIGTGEGTMFSFALPD